MQGYIGVGDGLKVSDLRLGHSSLGFRAGLGCIEELYAIHCWAC